MTSYFHNCLITGLVHTKIILSSTEASHKNKTGMAYFIQQFAKVVNS